jgi:predicted DNA-binding transcriptional regulator YafY
MDNEHKIKICYTNYRGETSIREIIPQKVWFGSTEWHPENGWLLNAFDVEKGADRSFSLKDIKAFFEK